MCEKRCVLAQFEIHEMDEILYIENNKNKDKLIL